MTSAREVIARALLIHDEPKARLEDQSAAEQERYRTEAKWFERYLEAEGLTVQTADEVDARIAEAVAGERKRLQIKCADISRLYKGEAQGSYETGYMDGASACAAAIAAEEKHQEELFWLREDDRADLKEQQMRDEGDDHDG